MPRRIVNPPGFTHIFVDLTALPDPADKISNFLLVAEADLWANLRVRFISRLVPCSI